KDEILARADILSLHMPLDGTTRAWLDRAALAAMKPGAVVVNVARGALIDEQALCEALAAGHIGAAGLDVLETEPADAGNPLFGLDNVVVSPHVAWLTRETFERSFGVAVEDCRRLRDGEPLLHRVA